MYLGYFDVIDGEGGVGMGLRSVKHLQYADRSKGFCAICALGNQISAI